MKPHEGLDVRNFSKSEHVPNHNHQSSVNHSLNPLVSSFSVQNANLDHPPNTIAGEQEKIIDYETLSDPLISCF